MGTTVHSTRNSFEVPAVKLRTGSYKKKTTGSDINTR